MPSFQRKTIPFTHRGMNWNAAPDKIPEGQVCWAKNIRVLQKNSVSGSHGNTFWASPASGGGVGTSYIHSISRLNNFNTAQPPSSFVEVLGCDSAICVGTQTTISNGSVNPIPLPNGSVFGMSGNPLTMVDAAPVGGASSWKYIGDSNQNIAIGYYPGDDVNPGAGNNGGKARAITMGMTPPVTTGILTGTPAGNLTGNYQWAFAYRNSFTGARSNLGAPMRQSLANPAWTLSAQAAQFSIPTTPIDPLTGLSDTNIVVDVYRFGGTVLRWAYVGSAPGGTLGFTDNLPDSQLLTAPSPSQAVDPSTGQSRFNLFRPFITPDIARFGNFGRAVLTATGAWTIHRQNTADPPFNLNWLPGSVISVNNALFTIFQVRDINTVELVEDATGILTNGTQYSWATSAGTLTAGTPLSHIWGVYGLGQSASYIFGCGSIFAPGTLFWTNGNDPDSTDIVNSLVVTSPSEPLRGGCIYDGQPYVWSTERMFAIYPSTTILGQFTVQEIPGAKGLWMEYSLTVQSNGFSDQSVSWRGKDGIYDWSPAGLRRLTDDLYPFFPHDNAAGIAPETIMPFLNAARSLTPENVGNLDDSQPKYHRLCWFQGVLFYDFVAQSLAGTTYSALVYDSVNCGGWVSVDQPFPTTTNPVARGVDVTRNNLKLSSGSSLYDYTGAFGTARSRIVTRAEDAGDPRANKLWGDYFLASTPAAIDLTVIPLTNFNNSAAAQNSVTPSTHRLDSTLDFQGGVAGIGVLSRTIAVDIQWATTFGGGVVSLYHWQPSFVPKPEDIGIRALDKTDDGYVGSKYLRGFVIEANTFTILYNLHVLVDGSLVSGTFALNTNGQQEVAFALPSPIVGAELQLQVDPATIGNVDWQLFNIRWIWDPWPELAALFSPFTDCGYRGNKFMQGGIIPLDTNGQNVTFTLASDSTPVTVGPFNTPAGRKTPVPFSFLPFFAHELQWQPNAPVRAWYDETKWVWEPSPEIAAEWKTPPMTHGMSGWLHQRLLWIAYASTGPVTFRRYFSDGTNESIQLPSTSGAYQKSIFYCSGKKSLTFQYEAISDAGHKIFVNDCEFHTKAWGSDGAYSPQKPLGAPSVVQGAQI